MTTKLRNFSISVRTSASYQRTIANLRDALRRYGFETICQLPLDRELERTVGLYWRHCTVLVVWSPIEAYQVVLSHRDGGLLVPFHLCVAEDGNSTFISVINHEALSPNYHPLGLQVLVRGLVDKIHEVLLEVAIQEEPGQDCEAQGTEASRF